jgi:thiol-disulfide isomerase/thioredoxin
METLALIKCSEEGADRARAIIEQSPTDLIRLAKAENQIAVSLNRYQLFGPAPQLFPAHVFNASGSEGALGPLRGQVTVILLAAHWCGPCHTIYPQIIEVYRRFQPRGVQVLLVTELSNSVADPKAPKPEAELATIQKLYINELKMPFPILVETAINVNSSGDVATKKAERDRKESLFSFYPMLLVIDKQSRTRAILPGALPGQGERLRTKIEELLKEN